MKNLDDKTEAVLKRFVAACQTAAGLNYAMERFNPKHDPPTKADYRRLDSPDYLGLSRRREHAVQQIRDLALVVLTAFKKVGQDASAVYDFMMRVSIIHHCDADASIPVEAAILNLRLHAQPGGDPPLPSNLEPESRRLYGIFRETGGPLTVTKQRQLFDRDSKTTKKYRDPLQDAGLIVKCGKRGGHSIPK